MSLISVPSLSRQMNEWAWCIDRSREFLISPNRSSSIFPLSLSYHIRWYVSCAGPLLIAGHKGPTGVYTERGGVGSKSSMSIYCAGRRRRSRRKKGDKDISGSPSGVGCAERKRLGLIAVYISSELWIYLGWLLDCFCCCCRGAMFIFLQRPRPLYIHRCMGAIARNV